MSGNESEALADEDAVARGVANARAGLEWTRVWWLLTAGSACVHMFRASRAPGFARALAGISARGLLLWGYRGDDQPPPLIR